MGRRKTTISENALEMIISINQRLTDLVNCDIPKRLHCIEEKLDYINPRLLTNEIPQANQLDNVHIISLLDRLEAAKKVLEKSEDIESTIEKLNNLEYFLRRFGTLKDLATHMLFIEKKMYILKEYLTVTEAADYLNLSPSLVYRLTSKHELPIYKPNGKTIFIRRDDLNRWIAKTRVMSDDEIEEYAATHMENLFKGNFNNKNKKK